jgi:hypothetical protein
MRGREAAQDCAVAARTNGRQVTGLDGRRSVAHSIDAAILPEQRPRAKPLLDLGGADPVPEELRPGHDAMRSGPDPSEFLFNRPALWSHYDL